MKFISRNSNYRYTIKHSMPAEPLTGRSAEPGIHVRFVNSIAIINDENVIQSLLNSDKYGIDFVSGDDADSSLKSNFSESNSLEPEHDLQLIENGHVQKTLNPKTAPVLDRDRQKNLDKLIEAKAMEIAEKMAPAMAKKILESLVKSSGSKKNKSDKTSKDNIKDIEEVEIENSDSK